MYYYYIIIIILFFIMLLQANKIMNECLPSSNVTELEQHSYWSQDFDIFNGHLWQFGKGLLLENTLENKPSW